jgi:uncharacterized membrane protein YccC
MDSNKKSGTKSGVIIFTIFMIPWLGFLVYALITDTKGFNTESIVGTILGIVIFGLVASFFGFSIAKKAPLLIVLASLCVVAIPVLWYYMPWLP